MAIARKMQVDLDVTPFYHCVSRCVRRAFLCGRDAYTGRSFDHRKAWVQKRIRLLTEVFAIDICAYAVMSNHLHLVLRIDRDRVARWSDTQVAERVGRIFRAAFTNLAEATPHHRRQILEKWRERLTSLSWFMRCLNEWLARRANQEDGCRGRFWEGRFKSQALLDDGALLACMSYVDLNPVRAGIANSLESSGFTSIQDRLHATLVAQANERAQPTTPTGLAPMIGERKRKLESERIAISLAAYVDLVEWTGRAVRPDKRGAITGPPPKLLEQVGLRSETWVESVRHWGARLWGVAGSAAHLRRAALARRRRWCKGQRWAAQMYRAA